MKGLKKREGVVKEFLRFLMYFEIIFFACLGISMILHFGDIITFVLIALGVALSFSLICLSLALLCVTVNYWQSRADKVHATKLRRH